MWSNYDCWVRYVPQFEWYEVEIDCFTIFVRGEALDKADAFALATMYRSNFDLEVIFGDSITVDYTNNIIYYNE